MADYVRLCGHVEVAVQYYEGEDEECLGHMDELLPALEACNKGEPSKHFLTREPLNSAEEYAQAVGWQLLRSV